MADPQVDETKDERQCGGGGPKRGGKSTQVNAVSLPGEAALMRQFLCASQVKAGSIPCIRHG
jgi:hypothetical protein